MLRLASVSEELCQVSPPPPHVRLFSEPWLMVLKQRIEILIYFVIWRRDLWKVEEICVTDSRQSFSSYNSLLFSKFSQFYDKSMLLRMLEEFFFWKVLYILCNRIKRFRHVDLLDLYCIHIFKINRECRTTKFIYFKMGGIKICPSIIWSSVKYYKGKTNIE